MTDRSVEEATMAPPFPPSSSTSSDSGGATRRVVVRRPPPRRLLTAVALAVLGLVDWRSAKAVEGAHLRIDNELIGTPEIDCHADTIEMRFRTKRRFTGKIFVQNHYSNPACRVDYSQAKEGGSAVGGIRLHHGMCDMDRRRMIHPDGMQFSTVLVVSFHPLFVTMTDRAFNINCFYREAVRDVNAGLTVSPIEPVTIAYDMPMPQCTYTIRKDVLDGPILHYAKIGDQVVHRWECDSEVYGMLVHTCYVEDGVGERQLVIDERGCHIHRIALGDPTYTEALNMAYRESNVFKFADRIGVRFSCEIKLCVKNGGGCQGITPPNCALSSDYQFDDDNNQLSVNEDVPLRDDPASGGGDASSTTIAARGTTAAATTRRTLPTTTTMTTATTTIAAARSVDPAEEANLYPSYGGYSPYKSKRHINATANNDVASNVRHYPTTDLSSQYVYVLDNIDNTEDEERLEAEENEEEMVLNRSRVSTTATTLGTSRIRARTAAKSGGEMASRPPICLSSTTFAVLALAVGLSFAAAAFAILHLLFRHLRSKEMDFGGISEGGASGSAAVRQRQC